MEEEEIRQQLRAAVKQGMLKLTQDGSTSVTLQAPSRKKPVTLSLSVNGDTVSAEIGSFFGKRRYSFLKSEIQ
jgi:hypothetical protein